MKHGFEIVIANMPDRENLVAELWYNGIMVAEVSHEYHDFQVQFYSQPASTAQRGEFAHRKV